MPGYGERPVYTLLKMVVLGDPAVGKSSIIKRFVANTFTDNYFSTVSINYEAKAFSLNGKLVKTQVWDTSGHKRFREDQKPIYRGAQAIILTFDLTNLESFDNIPNWIAETQQFAPIDCPILLVGNKMDLIESCKVTQEMIDSLLAHHRDVIKDYIPVSSKNGLNIDQIFIAASSLLNTESDNSNLNSIQSRSEVIDPFSVSPSLFMEVMNHPDILLKGVAGLLLVGGIICGGFGLATGGVVLGVGIAAVVVGSCMLGFFACKRRRESEYSLDENTTLFPE